MITPSTPVGAASPLFVGYGRPRYTQIPNVFLDEQMTDLSLSEIRVLLYLFRQTLGWQRDGATISQGEFLQGRHTKDGTPLDKGAGVSDTSLVVALRSLEAKGMVFAHRQRDPSAGNLPTFYEINMEGQRQCNEFCYACACLTACAVNDTPPPPKTLGEGPLKTLGEGGPRRLGEAPPKKLGELTIQERKTPKRKTPPPPTPTAHIPPAVPTVVVVVGELESGEGNDAPPCAPATAIPDLPAPLTPVQTAAAQIAAAGLATEREALRLAQISLEREDQEGYVQDQIQHALTDPGIHNRAAAFKANVEAGRTFVPPPGRRPQGLTILPALPLPLADVADTPVAADPLPDRVPDPAQAACAGIWQQASVYLRALYPHEYVTALRYATLAELDLAGGIAQLIVPNEGQRRIVAGLADGVALALQQTGQPPLHIVVATHQADPLRPSRRRSLA